MSFFTPLDEKAVHLNCFLVLFCKLSWNHKGGDAASGEKDGSVGKDCETAPGTQRFVTDGGLETGNEE